MQAEPSPEGDPLRSSPVRKGGCPSPGVCDERTCTDVVRPRLAVDASERLETCAPSAERVDVRPVDRGCIGPDDESSADGPDIQALKS